MTVKMSRRAHAIASLWAQGTLHWKLRPEQQRLKLAIDESNRQLIVGNISRRWGKSFTLVLYCIEQAIKSKQRIRYGAAFKSDLEEFIIPAFETILEDCPSFLRPEYMASKHVWRFRNGSTIKLVGLDKSPNGLRGNAINIIVLDEGAFVKSLKYQYTTVIIPATAKQKNIKILIFSTPPESPEHYFMELVRKAQLQPNGFYMTMTIDDISDLNDDEKKRLLDEVGGINSTTAQREFYCRMLVDETRSLSPNFSTEKHVKEFDPKHIAWRIFGDTGAKDKTVFLKVGYDHDTGLVVFRDELVPENRTPTSEIVTQYKAKFPEQYTLVMDAAAQLGIDYSALGLPSALPVKDDFGAGLLLLNNAFFQNKTVIHPDCKLLIKTLEGGLLTKNRNDYERTETLGHCDCAAAAIYALRGVDRITDLRPRPSHEVIFSPKRVPDHIKNIQSMGWKNARSR